MKTGATRLTITSILALALNGCASHNIQEYSKENSRAWNLTHSVGLSDLDDSEIPESQKDSLLYDGASLAIDSSLWTSDYGLGVDWSAGLGLGLLQSFAKSDEHGDRKSLVIWIPEDKAPNKETAMDWMIKSLTEATVKAVKDMGSSEDEIYTHLRELHVTFQGPYYIGEAGGAIRDGNSCYTVFNLHSWTISDELEKIPSYISENGYGYVVEAGGHSYPETYMYCEDDNAEDELTFIGKVTEHLPETMFYYSKASEHDGKQFPPAVFDHGTIELFIRP
ncbi:hypothetical protein [Marinobacter piscensis]|uniref:hypothetical protein n=1 Tax=Marinobacter piscensis TaxID=1562308 RepID=UPI0011A8F601|nr:hypothetical protein [Marinobacter piscensis]